MKCSPVCRGAVALAVCSAPLVLGAVATLDEPPARPAAPAAGAPATPGGSTANPTTTDQPKPGASTPAGPTPSASKPGDARPAAPAPAFPPAIAKQLYATSDLRGKPAPALEVEKWLSAEPARAGKVVLIDFWATWCPPCRMLIPELEEFQKTFRDDLVVIGVSNEPETKVRPFIEGRGGIGYAMAIDSKDRTNKAVGVQGLPHVLVIGSDGVVRWQGYPLQNEDRLTADKLRQIIEADKARRASSTPGDAKVSGGGGATPAPKPAAEPAAKK
jgi:thiol-disulfide isomerase/thioredoxin